MLIFERLDSARQREGLQAVLENAREPAAGVIRQVLVQGLTSLSDAQLNVFTKYIDPLLEEKCALSGCDRMTLAGRDFCDTCAVEYGN